jgi:hypothetical protein
MLDEMRQKNEDAYLVLLSLLDVGHPVEIYRCFDTIVAMAWLSPITLW